MKPTPRQALILAVIMLAGCASSEVPITAATPQEPDPRLVGLWRGDAFDDADGEVELFQIIKISDGSLTLREGPADDPAEREEILAVTTAEIAGAHYASIGAFDPADPRTNYLLVRYELVTEDRLQVYFASIEHLEAASRKGWIDGARQADRHFETYQLKAGARRLRKFIAAHGREVFADAGPLLERVRSDEVQATPRRR